MVSCADPVGIWCRRISDGVDAADTGEPDAPMCVCPDGATFCARGQGTCRAPQGCCVDFGDCSEADFFGEPCGGGGGTCSCPAGLQFCEDGEGTCTEANGCCVAFGGCGNANLTGIPCE